ncbi:hypothetical protein HIM_11735 [Hirsutella minnesotensis 3608]|uniref:phosphogluconate dehydrogenase (NADP(+)-dependent, decarboxylating) n=1 Tax=Hirsutella minnesotensis 3608 TaxID=1043627 RepID=A0A0F7ZFC0_9HYPO|nr:hypothetical protein HIM_11735 [Hirsutella minnesotensis 3608]
MEEQQLQITKVAMIGVGSMGFGMSLLLGEQGFEVFFFDPSEANVRDLESKVRDLKLNDRVQSKDSYEALCQATKSPQAPRVLILSTPHGSTGDKIAKSLRPHLDPGDIIIDCANEHLSSTERRQRELEPEGDILSRLRRGDASILKKLMPFFGKLAAKDRSGRPCVMPIGPGGSGHYAKMIHNGIGQGMMPVLAEVWFMLSRGLDLSAQDIGDIFESWNKEGQLRDCFLVNIGADVVRTRDENGHSVLDSVRDIVVQ